MLLRVSIPHLLAAFNALAAKYLALIQPSPRPPTAIRAASCLLPSPSPAIAGAMHYPKVVSAAKGDRWHTITRVSLRAQNSESLYAISLRETAYNINIHPRGVKADNADRMSICG